MISFTNPEIFLSIIYAVLYGGFFAFGYSVLLTVNSLIKSSSDIMLGILRFDKIFPLPRYKSLLNSQKHGPIIAFLSIVFFSVGFVLLSYLSLDGIIRLYMLVLSFASFYLLKITIFDFLRRLTTFIFDYMIMVCALPVRFVVLLLKKLQIKVQKQQSSKRK